MSVAEMRMLCWICDKTIYDKIRNENIRENVEVTPIVEKMVKNRFKWFVHLERRPLDFMISRIY